MKNDKYKKARGGWSRMLAINCAKCSQLICRYQKDGPGSLKRMYLDRIEDFEKSTDNLVCPNCNETLGVGIIYAKENRSAYRFIRGLCDEKNH